MGIFTLAKMGKYSYRVLMIQEFINEAEQYCRAKGIKLSTLGQYAVSDNGLFARLAGGGQCLPRTMDRVRAYITANPVAKTPEGAQR